MVQEGPVPNSSSNSHLLWLRLEVGPSPSMRHQVPDLTSSSFAQDFLHRDHRHGQSGMPAGGERLGGEIDSLRLCGMGWVAYRKEGFLANLLHGNLFGNAGNSKPPSFEIVFGTRAWQHFGANEKISQQNTHRTWDELQE